MPTATPRRTFLRSAAAGTLGVHLARQSVRGAVPDRVNVGLIGAGGMGTNHLRLLAQRDDVVLSHVCDVDHDRLAEAMKIVESTAISPRASASIDLRTVLDDSAVDAVFIATPDHWHAPAALLALEAGKHVYVEKPCCHNIREGRLLVEACARTGLRLQVGTQSRSTAFVREAIDRIRGGAIGEVLVAKAWNSQKRGSIGKSTPQTPPSNLEFDLWLGPAPEVPYRPNLLHAVWRWWHDFGCGDIGNDGVHDIDVALWGLGVDAHPSTVACLGGKYYFDDDQQFPDTQYAVFEYPALGQAGAKRQLIFEQRIWSPYLQEGYENGTAFYGTDGMLILGHSAGWKLYGSRNRLIAEQQGSSDLAAHHQNFLECVRGNSARLNADATHGHLAATAVHLANIAARVGRLLHFDPDSEQITSDPQANRLVRREYRSGHWAVPRGA